MHKIDLKKTAVSEIETYVPMTSPGQINWREYKSGNEVLETKLQNAGFLVITDSFNKGWKTFIDGNLTNTYRTNFSFQGIQIPKGTHIITRRYIPTKLNESLIICIIGLIFSSATTFQAIKNNKGAHKPRK